MEGVPVIYRMSSCDTGYAQSCEQRTTLTACDKKKKRKGNDTRERSKPKRTSDRVVGNCEFTIKSIE